MPTPAPSRPSALQALRYWWKLGWISFGGPAGQIAIMHHDLVERLHWISERRFLHALNYCMLLPGPEAQQLATYIGWLLHRTWGGVAAGALFVLPSVVILTLLSWLYMAFGSVPAVAGILYGIKPAVTAIVLHAAWRIGSRVLKSPLLWTVAATAFAAIFFFAVPFPAIILVAGAIGVIGGRFAPRQFSAASGHASSTSVHSPAVIDDETPTPAHARFRLRTLALTTFVFLGLWSAAFLALRIVAGNGSTLPEMARFFTKAALLTFGGAYAVLPYVVQGAVTHYGWLTTGQMIDGLALGETTPGPLIMVVAFVGFVGGWTKAVFGPEHLLLAGVAAALVVTFFTFLPSFFFILAGGPVIESTHGQVRFIAPLSAITAAVVGVIVNLGVFFAYHVFWPRGLAAPVDWIASVIAVAAVVALFRFKLGIIPVIAASGAAGLLLVLAGAA